MKIDVFNKSINQIFDRAKEKGVEITDVDLCIDGYDLCIQFYGDKRPVADIDFSDDGPVIYYFNSLR